MALRLNKKPRSDATQQRDIGRVPPYKLLDVFRGLAALWVVMDHSSDRWLSPDHLAYLHQPLYWISSYGRLGVTIFFVISGYCITAAAWRSLVLNRSVAGYAKDRVRRIYPPYFASLVLMVLSIQWLAVASAHHWIPAIHHPLHLGTGVSYWMGNLFLLQSEFQVTSINVVYWSLCYEIAFYAVIGVFLGVSKLIQRKHGPHVATVAFVALLTGCTVCTLAFEIRTGDPVFPIDLWHLFALGGLLFCGIEINGRSLPDLSSRTRAIIASCLSIVALLTGALAALRQIGDTGLGLPSTRVACVTALVFAALLLVLRRYDDVLTRYGTVRPLLWLGSFSYSLYLVHPVVLPYFEVFGRHIGLNGDRYWIDYLIQLAAAVLSGRIFFLNVERRFLSKRQTQRIVEEHLHA